MKGPFEKTQTSNIPRSDHLPMANLSESLIKLWQDRQHFLFIPGSKH